MLKCSGSVLHLQKLSLLLPIYACPQINREQEQTQMEKGEGVTNNTAISEGWKTIVLSSTISLSDSKARQSKHSALILQGILEMSWKTVKSFALAFECHREELGDVSFWRRLEGHLVRECPRWYDNPSPIHKRDRAVPQHWMSGLSNSKIHVPFLSSTAQPKDDQAEISFLLSLGTMEQCFGVKKSTVFGSVQLEWVSALLLTCSAMWANCWLV